MSFQSSLLARFSRALRRLGADTGAVAAVEFVLVAPGMLILIGLVVFAGQALEIQRKVTLTARTLTDLASQQAQLGSTSTTYTYSQILTAASLVIAPYDSSQLSMVLSEISTNGTTTGTVVWSEATGGATALTKGSSVPVSANLANAGYLILGAVSYNYAPLGFVVQEGAMTLSDSLYLGTRLASGPGGEVLCTGCP